MNDVVIVSAVRTPVGKFQGALAELSAVQLGAIVVREAVFRAGIDASSVDECLMGCVLAAGLGQNPARQAALRGGLADTVSAMTINMVCGSGLKAVALGAHAVMAGDVGCGPDRIEHRQIGLRNEFQQSRAGGAADAGLSQTQGKRGGSSVQKGASLHVGLHVHSRFVRKNRAASAGSPPGGT